MFTGKIETQPIRLLLQNRATPRRSHLQTTPTIDRKLEEAKHEICGEIADTNAKLDINLQRLTGSLDADTP
ncbi:MAG: hypothetical protein F6J87_27805 [Spirulina sp. SIO3F2]|nr:hypothetical protein [Spirulina sp. SIO3F2]